MLPKFSIFSSSYFRYCLYGVISLILTLAIALTAIKPSYGIPWAEILIRGVQVVQLSSISDKQELEIGKGINDELISSGQAKIYSGQEINDYIKQIGERLAKTSERSDLPYTFQVVDDSGINAFATMGGYVYVNTGLIEAADNESELASVIGHEIGHIVGRHSINHMREAAISQGLLSAAGLDRSNAIQIGVQLAVSRPNSRSDELEADRFGLENLKKSGYAPSGMLGFMKKLLEQGGSVPTFLSTHPATGDRIAKLESKIDPATANQGDGLDGTAYKQRTESI
jgi:beta-barrel assembly-enhancing protease